MQKIDLSIIIPAYNCEKYIEKCIKSIIEQKSDLVEIIIINDGSTDKTQQICKNFAQKHNNIKLINQQNRGVSYSRNIGIQNSNGKYVMFVDADDYLVENSVEAVLKLLTEDVDVLRCSYVVNSKKEEIFTETIFDIYKFFQKTNQNVVWGQVIKRELLNDIKFNENLIYGEDELFNCQLYNKCKSIKYIDTVLYNYRQNVDSVSRDYKNYKVKSKIENLIYVFNEIMSQYEDNDLIKLIENKFVGEIVPQIMMLTFDKAVSKKEVLKQFEEILNNDLLKKIFEDLEPKELTMCRYKTAYKFMKNKEYSKLYIYSKIYKKLKKIQQFINKTN